MTHIDDVHVITDHTRETRELRDEIAQMRLARHTSFRIGIATGLIMRDRHLAAPDAFEALRRAARDSRRRLLAVADDVIDHGTVD
jgi:AmiR/NasT family two-component response regulator